MWSDILTDNTSCPYPICGPIPTINGCTNSSADNYDPLATFDDGTCTFSGCMDNGIDIDYDNDGMPAFNYDSLATTEDGSV